MSIDYPTAARDRRQSRNGKGGEGSAILTGNLFFPRVLIIYHPRFDLRVDDNDQGWQANR